MRIFPLLAVALILAGCASSPSTPTSPSTSAASFVPQVDGARARAWWDGWVNAHPGRMAGTPENIQASDAIAADLAAAGYKTSVVYYVPKNGASPASAGIRTIIGVKEGTTQKDHVLAWLAHYDSTQTTIYAAYDDGSGTATTMETARALANYTSNKTLMAIFFDGEEEGLLASQEFAQQAKNDKAAQFDLAIGLDMTGINCPGHAWPLYAQPDAEHQAQIFPILNATLAKAKIDVGFGEDSKHCVTLLEANDRNSDENSFRSQGIPVVRYSGGRNAGDYPQYHKPGDTTDFVYQFMGGKENYEKGIAMAANVTALTILSFDHEP